MNILKLCWIGHIARVIPLVVVLSVASVASFASPADDSYKGRIDVLNFWTSGSEAKSMAILKQMLAKQDIKMINDAVAGAGGANMRTVLKSRIQSQNIPGAAHIKWPSIKRWCKTGLVGNIDSVAKAQNWNDILAPRIAKQMQCNDHYVAVPFNIHRLNWLWINRSLLKKVGADIPHTWNDFINVLKKLKKAGITPLAGGSNTWQVAVQFDSIVAATGGAQFYRDAFVKLDPEALSSSTMAKSFKRLRTLKKYTNKNATGLKWNRETGLVVHGKAAMQIMGDWAKGEITIRGATPGKEIACVTFPGSKPAFIYTVDSFLFFKTDSQAVRKGQKTFARTVMTPKFQRLFNMAKGSIPVREGVSLKGFDACAKKSRQAYINAKKHNALAPSMSVDNAEYGAIRGAIIDIIAKFYYNPSMSAKEAAQKLALRVKQAQKLMNL